MVKGEGSVKLVNLAPRQGPTVEPTEPEDETAPAGDLDIEKISLQDVEEFKSILKGESVRAISNSNVSIGQSHRGRSRLEGKELKTEHEWAFHDGDSEKTLDVQFQSPQNISKVELALTLECK